MTDDQQPPRFKPQSAAEASPAPPPLPPEVQGVDNPSQIIIGWWWIPMIVGALAAAVIDAAAIVYAIQLRS